MHFAIDCYKAGFPLRDFFRAKRYSIVKFEYIFNSFQPRARISKEKIASREKSRVVENRRYYGNHVFCFLIILIIFFQTFKPSKEVLLKESIGKDSDEIQDLKAEIVVIDNENKELKDRNKVYLILSNLSQFSRSLTFLFSRSLTFLFSRSLTFLFSRSLTFLFSRSRVL